MERKKVLELDKICRVCISERKDMRPLFSEKVAEMLMECASVTIENTEGWPDKICVQCVHAVSRCHAFKSLVERSDKELREYIKSLTVRVVIEEPTPQEIKIEPPNQTKLLQKQQKLLEKQQQQQQQHQQLLLQQQQQQQQQVQVQQVQQQQQITLPEPIAIHSVNSMPRQQQQHNTTQIQQQQQTQIIPATTAMPQQIVLPNGQIITTAQIVTHAGPPQIAQIINTNGTATTTTTTQPVQTVQQHHQQQQFTPQLIQTTSGQTLQIIQQPNGQQTLQLVQLVPQRTIGSGGGNVIVTTTTDDGSIIDEETLIEQSEQHLIDDDNDEEDEDSEQICETIVVEEEQLVSQQLLATPRHEGIGVDDDNISQSETQELEYLEDITVTTSSHPLHQLHHHQQHHNQHHQLHHHMSDESQHHLLHDDDDDIIEEIHMEEEMLEDDGSGGVMHVMDTNAEFISEDEDVSQQHLVTDCVQHDGDQLQYTVMEADDDDDDALVEADVSEVFQAACGGDLNTSGTSSTLDFNQTVCDGNGSSVTVVSQKTQPPRKGRKNCSKALFNSRQLAATASSIASAGDDDFEIDSKFITEFISQQTTSLGSGRYVCNLCRQEFKQFKGLQNHMHLHSNWIRANCKKQPQCEICFKSFKGPGMLKMHMKTHQSASRTPTCNICSRPFKSKAILYRHRQSHQQRSYLCGVENCRKSFSTPITLRAHSDRKHANNAQPKFKCGGCSVLFDNVDILHTHVQMTGHGSSSAATTTTASNTTVPPGMVVVIQA